MMQLWSSRSSTLMIRAACLVAVMAIMMQGPALCARDSKYCESCGGSLQCPEPCPDFNNGNSKSLCHIDCQTCSTECKLNTNGTSSGTSGNSTSASPSSSPSSPGATSSPPRSSSNGSTIGSPPVTSSTSNGCNEIGAICKDPRFIGGDGGLFYFHGKANEDFCIVTDTNFHINGHFIGKRVEGRPRDFTWVQAIGIMFGSHKVSIGAKKVGLWDNDVDQMEVFYDDENITIDTNAGESWVSPHGDFKMTRARKVNSINIQVARLLKVSINVTYVDEEDNKIHNYGIDSEDCFAHLDLRFTFLNLSSQVDGVLRQTYKDSYISQVKEGVPMPTMGGYEKFKASSIFATDCLVGVFDPSSILEFYEGPVVDAISQVPSMSCTSMGENGIVCRH